MGIIVLVIRLHIRAKKRLDDTFLRLARRVNGRCSLGGLWGTPSVKFAYRNAYTLLDIFPGSEGALDYTQLHMAWPDSEFRCEVYPGNAFSRLNRFFGMQDIEIGSAEFDRDYVIQGNHSDEIRNFLNADVRQRINRLQMISQNGDFYLSISGGRLIIKTRGHVSDYADLEKFVMLSLDLYDCATQAGAAGIKFVESLPEAKLSLKEAVCQVCGESVKLDAVFCRACKTPHHKDCWEYYGACSTYGCGQRRYLVQRAR